MSICFCAGGCARNPLADPGVFGTDCSCWCHTTDHDLRLCTNCGTELGRLETGTRCTDCAALPYRRTRGGIR
jgi:hypothetical protein